jgi:hypothetical protein
MKTIKTWLWQNIGWYIKSIYNRFYNLYRWLPIIWKDRDWDDWYIFTILQTKLKHQAEYIGTKDRHTRAQYDAQRMRTCVRLIEKVKEESYQDEYMEYNELNFGSTPVPGTDTYKLDLTTTWENFDEYFLAYPLDYKRVLNGAGWLDINNCKDDADKKKKIAMNMSHLRGQRAKKILFQLLDRHIEGWWD